VSCVGTTKDGLAGYDAVLVQFDNEEEHVSRRIGRQIIEYYKVTP